MCQCPEGPPSQARCNLFPSFSADVMCQLAFGCAIGTLAKALNKRKRWNMVLDSESQEPGHVKLKEQDWKGARAKNLELARAVTAPECSLECAKVLVWLEAVGILLAYVLVEYCRRRQDPSDAQKCCHRRGAHANRVCPARQRVTSLRVCRSVSALCWREWIPELPEHRCLHLLGFRQALIHTARSLAKKAEPWRSRGRAGRPKAALG